MTDRFAFQPGKDLLAFCHIEKAAGTSLIHVLRRVFFLRFAAVRPLRITPDCNFSSADLQTYRRLNPRLACIAGHALVPFNSLQSPDRRILFVTQIREPVARVRSQFKFWRQRMGKGMSARQFLDHPTVSNFQVRKLAGSDDLELAKSHIRSKFLVAGPTEDFDRFLVLLSNALDRPASDFRYARKNLASDREPVDIPDFFDEIARQKNSLDEQLYHWIKDDYFPELINSYRGDFDADLTSLGRANRKHGAGLGPAMDSVYRNGYLKPVTGLIRRMNGLPWAGSYAYQLGNRRDT